MRCIKCKKKYDPTLDFCPKCGMENTTGLRGEERSHRYINEDHIEASKANNIDNRNENKKIGERKIYDQSSESVFENLKSKIQKYEKTIKNTVDSNPDIKKLRKERLGGFTEPEDLSAQCVFCGTRNK